MKENALIIFIKNIEKGKVKTRLAATVGDDRALAIYMELLRHTRDTVKEIVANRYLYYSKFVNTEDDWLADDFGKEIQSSGGLGERMQSAFRNTFETNQKVVIVGSDCASLTEEIVQDAFDQLDENDFVIGPALDGGYYLLGMRTFEPSVFEDIEWSTEQVLPQTISKIENLNKKYYLLPALSDIDYEADWKKYGWDF